MQIDTTLNTLCGTAHSSRPNPAADVIETPLDSNQAKHSARLMRVNHSGEVAAQALYQGQMAIAHQTATHAMLQQAATEEVDHLAWTAQRVQELGGQTSKLNALWYSGAWLLGFTMGLASDRISLGFVEETEKQVAQHLESHLQKLPDSDHKSRAIIEQMRIDEAHHGQTAHNAGATELPTFAKIAMKFYARIMTTVAYWL